MATEAARIYEQEKATCERFISSYECSNDAGDKIYKYMEILVRSYFISFLNSIGRGVWLIEQPKSLILS
jgi:hypothetical protein